MSDEDQGPEAPDEKEPVVIEPIGDRIVVEVVDVQSTSSGKGGVKLIIPEMARNQPQVGRVIAVGQGIPFRGAGTVTRERSGVEAEVEHHEMQKIPVELDDYVIYGKFSGVEVELNGETIFVLRSDEVLARVRNYQPPPPEEELAESA